jgi:hypothetical protein
MAERRRSGSIMLMILNKRGDTVIVFPTFTIPGLSFVGAGGIAF